MIFTHLLNAMEQKYLNIKGAAEVLGVSSFTLRNWDRRGRLTAYRHPINNYRVYRMDELWRFMRRLENSKNEAGGKRIDISAI